MTKALFCLALTLAVTLVVTTVSANAQGQCIYEGQNYSEGAVVTMDGESKLCVCDADGENCQWR